MRSLGAFCNTFDLHKVIIGLENQFLVFFERPLKTGFTVVTMEAQQAKIQSKNVGPDLDPNLLTL